MTLILCLAMLWLGYMLIRKGSNDIRRQRAARRRKQQRRRRR